MKKNVITFIVMVAMLTATFLTGCDTKDTNTGTATADQTVVATADETSPTEDATATETEAKTVAPTEKSTEADNKKSDKDAEDNEDENENEDSGSASNTSNNNSSSGSNTTTTNKKPSSSNNSSSNTNKKPSSNNNSGSNTTNNKPNNNSSSNNNSNSNSKPNTNNNNNSGNTNTKPAPAPVITDDTDIPHSQLCTDANMQKVTSAVNDYFINLGMIYNPSLNAGNCGWFLVQTNLTASYECSVNYFKSNTIYAFESDANTFLSMSNATYSDLTFYCYAEYQGNGEYNIYFCHE